MIHEMSAMNINEWSEAARNVRMVKMRLLVQYRAGRQKVDTRTGQEMETN